MALDGGLPTISADGIDGGSSLTPLDGGRAEEHLRPYSSVPSSSASRAFAGLSNPGTTTPPTKNSGRRIRFGSSTIRRIRSSSDSVPGAKPSLRAVGERHEKMSLAARPSRSRRSSPAVKRSLKNSRSLKLVPVRERASLAVRHPVQVRFQ